MATHPNAKRRRPRTVNAVTLASLDPDRLAQLLADAARSDAKLKRLLTLEIAADAADLVEEIDKQAQRLRTAKGRLNAARALVFARELDQLIAATASKLGALDPAAAVERLLDLLEGAPALLARRTGEGRPLLDAFGSIAGHVAALLPTIPAGEARAHLLATVHRLGVDDRLEAATGLLAAVAAAGDVQDRRLLQKLVTGELAALECAGARPGVIAQRVQVLTEALAQIADASGDVDAFRAAQERRDPRLRDHLALTKRLLAADRAGEALEVLEATPAGAARSGTSHAELRITVLEVLGRRAEAQAERWALFCRTLSVDLLRSYLKRLPDFEDVEQEEAALAHAEQHRDAPEALAFLVAWPDHRRAAALVRRRLGELSVAGDVAIITAAERLAHRDPLAATLLYRLIVEGLLSLSRGGGYLRAVKMVGECASLSVAVGDWEGRPDHQAYVARLRSRHGRHAKFWRKLASVA